MTAAEAIDDIDSRPGSTTSLLRTIVGLYLRRLGGWMAIADLVRLMDDVGVPDVRTRTGVVRLKKKRLLLQEKRAAVGYALAPEAEPMLRRGDRRIFDVRRMRAGDPWCLISFTVAESHRDVRHQVRRRLQWIGCGMVSPALWICPDYLADEVEAVLRELDAQRWVLFRTEEPRVQESLPAAVRTWWDLAHLRGEHELFLQTVAALDATPVTTDREAFAAYIALIDAWRILPYVDPGLPIHLLPADWPGERSVDGFHRLSASLRDRAWAHVQSVTGAAGGIPVRRASQPGIPGPAASAE